MNCDMETKQITTEDLQQLRKDLVRELKVILCQIIIQDSKPWLKSHVVRKLMKISPGTLQHLRDTGAIKFSKVGGIIFYSMSDIEELLRDRVNS
ncbi:MAG: helix-turn-helix domain-containing protein [Chitinophagaceae bacterium]